MNSTAWEHISSREANRLQVLTRSKKNRLNSSRTPWRSWAWRTAQPPYPIGCGSFRRRKERRFPAVLSRGTKATLCYNAVAVYPIAGKVLGIRYPEIFDTIYMVAALFEGLVSADDACLDIGTCTGFAPLALGRLGIGRWHGIDRSASCIAYAERCAADLFPDHSPSFKRQELEKLSRGIKYKLVLNSRGPQMTASGDQYSRVASVLESGGFLVYVDEYVKNESEARRIYSKSGLSLIYRDIVGGWCQATQNFGVYSLSVFVKAAVALPPGDYRGAYETLWSPHFQDYSNSEVRDEPFEKTLCMMRDHKRSVS